MFFGYFFGLFEGRGQGYKKRRSEEASDPELRAAIQASMPPAAPAAPAPPVLPAQPQTADQSLLRLSLDPEEQPCLELDGQNIDIAQMEPQQRRRLIDLMVIMRPWIEAGPVARQEATASAPRPGRGTGPLVTPPTPARGTGPLAMPPAPARGTGT